MEMLSLGKKKQGQMYVWKQEWAHKISNVLQMAELGSLGYLSLSYP